MNQNITFVESNEEDDLVTSINIRILLTVSVAIIKQKPANLSYYEYCKQIKENVIKKLKGHDPHGILLQYQRQSLLRCIKEILPKTPSEDQDDDNSQFIHETWGDVFPDDVEKQRIDSLEPEQAESQNFDSGYREIESEQLFDQSNVSVSLLGDSESDQWNSTRIRTNIDFMKNILHLKALLKKNGTIPTNALVNILSDSDASAVSEKFTSVSSHMLEYRLNKIDCTNIVENMFTQVLNYLEDNLFSKVEEDKFLLVNYRGTDMSTNINYFLEVLPLCPKYLHDTLFNFIRKHMKYFFIDCKINLPTQDVLEQIVYLLLKLCSTKRLLVNTIHFILGELFKLSHAIKSLLSFDQIADEANGPLLRKLVNTTHLLSLAKQCTSKLSKLSKNEKKSERLIQIWRQKNRKIIEAMREYFFLFVIEGDGVFKSKKTILSF